MPVSCFFVALLFFFLYVYFDTSFESRVMFFFLSFLVCRFLTG